MQISENFKVVIILEESLPLGLIANTSAVLALTLGHKIEGLIGKALDDKDGNTHEGLTQIPVPVLKCSAQKLREIYDQARESKNDLFLVDVTEAAQTTKNYADYQEKLAQVLKNDLNLLGIALAGNQKLINKLSGSLALLR